MKFCKDCENIACCDFCKHAIQEMCNINGKLIAMGPIGCKLHSDSIHQNLAKSCSSCDDFCCIHIKEDK